MADRDNDDRGRLVVVGVPVDSVSAPDPGAPLGGCELMPAALREAGLAQALRASDAGDLAVRVAGHEADPEAGMLGWPSVAHMTGVVRARVSEVTAAGAIPLVVGGCCAVVPGAVAGARDAAGPLGLAYVDGHLDLYDGQSTPTSGAADMPVAVIAGHAPQPWCEQVGAPLVAPERIVLLGAGDREEAASLRSAMPEDLGIAREFPPRSVRSIGAADAGRRALRRAGQRYWVHLGVDVFDPQEFPASDYPNAGGLLLAEVRELLAPLAGGPGLAGMSVSCYNPELDPYGECGRALVALLGDLLAR